MTPKQALQILDKIRKQVPLVYNEHNVASLAVAILDEFINQHSKPATNLENLKKDEEKDNGRIKSESEIKSEIKKEKN